MRLLLLIPSIILLTTQIDASPFELTDKYIKDFEDGIQHLKNVSLTTKLQEGSFDPKLYDEEAALKEAENVDFIIIGGGTSGAVIANRLSEVPEWKVLLLESGAPETPYSQIPAITDILLNTPYNWGYKTEPQEKACIGSIDDRCSLRTGRAMGGTSSINRMVYTRGNAIDYDTWADNGNDGWCYNDVMPTFKKSENAQLHQFDRKHHSQGGLLNVEEPKHESLIREAFLKGGEELGYKIIDYNGDEQLGFATPQQLTVKGKRSSVSRSYLETSKNRKNLSIRPFSHVVDILITPHTKNASGVKYIHRGKMFIANNAKEVIVAGGAINSPQLLMLSGIGKKEALKHIGIEQIHELPVGENLKDHIAYVGLNFVSNETLSKSKSDHDEDLIHWLKDGSGPLSKIGIEGLAFIKTEISKVKKDHPDIELILIPHGFNIGYEKIKNEYGLAKNVYDAIYKPNENHKGFTILVALPHPKSTGSVSLRTKDPFNYPIINGNYYTDPDHEDLSTMIAGIRKALALTKTEAFKKLNVHLNEHRLTACEKFEHLSDDDLKCSIRHLTISLGDPCGTNKMGPKTDKNAVVDHELKVHGIENLRVADASVIPNTLTGHMTAPEVMIGEKAADIIKKHWH
ncbi:glucose dehydrogenase [FAD, quinone]-like [Onthophagus taurus]|uniref:glucose dehydrogenase [FAD, quinone]-like n=1 Tax=Onthophagus taurus TaxID=166361 RepID=UPI000C1FF43F|nr:glucose dehydrogenase [FAD, quinone]-like [Onthophagus taurus]